MITLTYNAERRKAVESAMERVLTSAQRTMVRELLRAEDPTGPAPRVEDMLYWIRLNMPVASSRIDAVLHPRD